MACNQCGKIYWEIHVQAGKLLNSDMEIHFLELPKIMKLDRRTGDALEEWMLYLNNLEGKEMKDIAMGNPALSLPSICTLRTCIQNIIKKYCENGENTGKLRKQGLIHWTFTS